MRILSCADSGLLVEVDNLESVLALHDALSQLPMPGVIDLVPAGRTLLLKLDPLSAEPHEIERVVRSVEPSHQARSDGELVLVPVVYDGVDLLKVATMTGLSEREIVEAHTASEWTVAFCGFAPGFAYLAGGDSRLEVSRTNESRTRVPAGSVGLAGRFSGIYPRESPGGWQLIGRTDLRIWSVTRQPPALLRPGVRVQFKEVCPA